MRATCRCKREGSFRSHHRMRWPFSSDHRTSIELLALERSREFRWPAARDATCSTGSWTPIGSQERTNSPSFAIRGMAVHGGSSFQWERRP